MYKFLHWVLEYGLLFDNNRLVVVQVVFARRVVYLCVFARSHALMKTGADQTCVPFFMNFAWSTLAKNWWSEIADGGGGGGVI